jgi:ankyrin repeat protein
VEKGDETIVKLLLENGAQPDFEDEEGQTPLSRAVEKGSVTVLQLLLAKEMRMDFKYNIVSERHLHLKSTILMADNAITVCK